MEGTKSINCLSLSFIVTIMKHSFTSVGSALVSVHGTYDCGLIVFHLVVRQLRDA